MASDDFDFDDDLFNDDDFDDFRFDDEGDDFGDDAFGDDAFDDADLDAGLGLDDDFDFDDGGFDDDEAFVAEDSGGGPSRGFLFVAGLLVLLLLVGFGALIGIATGVINITGEPSDTQLTATRIVELNETTEAQIIATQMRQTEAANATMTATLFTPTPSPTASDTPTPTADANATATSVSLTQTADFFAQSADMTATALAQLTADVFATQTAEAGGGIDVSGTQTAIALTQSTDGGVDSGGGFLSAVEMTATALAEIFQDTPVGTDGTVISTPIGGAQTTTTGIATTGGTTTLPDTGLFDDLGAENAGIFFLMAFGLIGVIVGSRRLRANSKRA